jgi:hypothetical protein
MLQKILQHQDMETREGQSHHVIWKLINNFKVELHHSNSSYANEVKYDENVNKICQHNLNEFVFFFSEICQHFEKIKKIHSEVIRSTFLCFAWPPGHFKLQ